MCDLYSIADKQEKYIRDRWNDLYNVEPYNLEMKNKDQLSYDQYGMDNFIVRDNLIVNVEVECTSRCHNHLYLSVLARKLIDKEYYHTNFQALTSYDFEKFLLDHLRKDIDFDNSYYIKFFGVYEENDVMKVQSSIVFTFSDIIRYGKIAHDRYLKSYGNINNYDIQNIFYHVPTISGAKENKNVFTENDKSFIFILHDIIDKHKLPIHKIRRK